MLVQLLPNSSLVGKRPEGGGFQCSGNSCPPWPGGGGGGGGFFINYSHPTCLDPGEPERKLSGWKGGKED